MRQLMYSDYSFELISEHQLRMQNRYAGEYIDLIGCNLGQVFDDLCEHCVRSIFNLPYMLGWHNCTVVKQIIYGEKPSS
jgi:hypothetical protein